MCKVNGEMYNNAIYSGLIMFSVVGKVYGRILIKRIREATKGVISEEQCDLRREGRCVDQVFSARQVCEKFLATGKEVFWVSIDIVKVFDRIGRKGSWNVLELYW